MFVFKKIVSYCIVFCILYADVDKAFGGGVHGKVALDPEDIPASSSPPKPTPHTHSQPLVINESKPDKRTPLLGGSSAVSIPTLISSTGEIPSSLDVKEKRVLSSSSEKNRIALANQEEENLIQPLNVNFEDVAKGIGSSNPALLKDKGETDSEEGTDESAEQIVVKPPLSGEASDIEKSDLEGSDALSPNQQSENECLSEKYL